MQNITGRIFVYSHTLHTTDHTKNHSANLTFFFGKMQRKESSFHMKRGAMKIQNHLPEII